MNCPDCGRRLGEHRDPPVMVDVCSYCPGIWFDKGEIESYLAIKYLELGPFTLEKPTEDLGVEETERDCPSCSGAKLERGVVHGVAVAHCPQCGGLWMPKESVDPLRGGKIDGTFNLLLNLSGSLLVVGLLPGR